ncbi:MAG: VWA domain-containing protein [Treponema sp.]|nr:VWA domain-containing protein [Treponema sp.]
MSALAFDHPLFLLFLLAFIPLFLADRFSARRRRILQSLPRPLRSRFFRSGLLFRLSMALLIVALSGPRWGEAPESSSPRRAVDVAFAIDVSRSMDVPDGLGEYLGPGIGRTRLERGLEIAREAAAALPGARFAVAISRGRGMLAVPLTWDIGAIEAFFDALEEQAITGFGTNLEALVDAALGAFQPSPPTRRVVALISDGEELSGDLRAAADRSREQGARILAVALGSEAGGTFPGGGATISRRESEPLRVAAARADGAYIDGSRPDAGAQLAAQITAAGGAMIGSAGSGGGPMQRWPLFAALSLLAFGASKLCLLGRAGRRKEAAR